MQLAKPVKSTYKMNGSISQNCQKTKTARSQNAILQLVPVAQRC